MQKLGRIDRVELRSIWTSEDRHFTPWLAQPEDLELLGAPLGIDLDLEAQEKDVGPFRADILCKNTAEEDSWVVIENQIEKTDHKHLGQLMTYAAGLQAKTVVWNSADTSSATTTSASRRYSNYAYEGTSIVGLSPIRVPGQDEAWLP